MAFTGKYVLVSQENGDEFMKALGIENSNGHKSDKEIITDIYENDVFKLKKVLMGKTWSNTFTIGKESELETLDGQTFKTTVTLDGGKLMIKFPKYVYTAELVAGMLFEVNTIGTITNKLVSMKKI